MSGKMQEFDLFAKVRNKPAYNNLENTIHKPGLTITQFSFEVG